MVCRCLCRDSDGDVCVHLSVRPTSISLTLQRRRVHSGQHSPVPPPSVPAERETNSRGAPTCQTTHPTTMRKLSDGSRGSRVEVLEVLEVPLHLLMWYSSSSLRLQGEKQAICRHNGGGNESQHRELWVLHFILESQKYFSKRKQCNHLQDHLAILAL